MDDKPRKAELMAQAAARHAVLASLEQDKATRGLSRTDEAGLKVYRAAKTAPSGKGFFHQLLHRAGPKKCQF